MPASGNETTRTKKTTIEGKKIACKLEPLLAFQTATGFKETTTLTYGTAAGTKTATNAGRRELGGL